VFGALGWAVVAGATPGPGSQVAATQWTTNNPPTVGTDSYDSSVSCVSSVFCVSTVLVETTGSTTDVQQWDGSSWHTVALPGQTGTTAVELSSVSCTSTSFCMAVGIQAAGSVDLPIVYAWNGTAWSVSTTPTLPSPYTGAELMGVSCTGPTWCMATGVADNSSTTFTDTLAEQWNGSAWTIVNTPNIAGHTDDVFSAVSCTGPSTCMAVGSNTATGTGLTLPSSGASPPGAAQPGFLGSPDPIAHALAPVQSTNPHIAVTTHLLAEQWNGTAWTVTTTDDPAGVTNPEFFGVSCAGAGFCMATGYNEVTSSVQGFTEEWSGGSWSQVALPISPSAGGAAMLGISCISPTSCTAVGSTFTGTSTDEVLTASWNGSTWVLGTVPTPSDPEAAWFGVSCLGGGDCVATGGINTGSSTIPFNGQAPIGRAGYRMAASDGGVFAFGPGAPNLGAPYLGSMCGTPLNAPVVGMAVMPSGDGYDLVAADGGVFNFGSASFYGSTGGIHLNKPVVGMAMTADGGGYWLVASDGGVFTYGDAQFYGSTGGIHLNNPIVGMAPTPNGLGYYLVASDGGIFAFGDAAFFGSTGGLPLQEPIVGMTAAPDGSGYWLVASDGGIFSFGDVGYFGSAGGMPTNAPVVGMDRTADGQGYWMVGRDGGIFNYGDAGFYGSAGGLHLNRPIVGMAAIQSL
jgi:hypothetical protein